MVGNLYGSKILFIFLFLTFQLFSKESIELDSKIASSKILCTKIETIFALKGSDKLNHLIDACEYLIIQEPKEEYYIALAFAYEHFDKNKAIDIYKEAYVKFPTSLNIICGLAEYEYLYGKIENAEKISKDGLDLDPNINSCTTIYLNTLIIQDKQYDYNLFYAYMNRTGEKDDIYTRSITAHKALYDIAKGKNIDYKKVKQMPKLFFEPAFYKWILINSKSNKRLKEAYEYLFPEFESKDLDILKK